MERLHRNSQGFAVTLSGSTAISVRPTGFTTIPHTDPATGAQAPRKVKFYQYKPNYQSEPVAIVWDNDKNIVVVEDSIAQLLLGRKWAANVSVAQFEWWNGEVDKLEIAAAENLLKSQEISDSKTADGKPAADALTQDALSKDTATAEDKGQSPPPVAQSTPAPTPEPAATPAPEPKPAAPAPTPEPAKSTAPTPPAGRQRNKPAADPDKEAAKAAALARAEAEQSAANGKQGDA